MASILLAIFSATGLSSRAAPRFRAPSNHRACAQNSTAAAASTASQYFPPPRPPSFFGFSRFRPV